ncbi:MAG: PEGA domain-containing protein [Hyphomonadaceae bacterium]|nr:PEGA domain-containing protein [Hyphomonadaceae bacterium]
MLKIIAAIAAASSLCACATITRGTTQAFEVRTTPAGASVETSNGLYCKSTPCVIPNVARNSNFTVTVTKPGYKTVTTNVTNANLGGGTANLAGNILVGGIIGIGVDASNGSLQDLVPNPLILELEPETPALTAAPNTSPAASPPATQPVG